MNGEKMTKTLEDQLKDYPVALDPSQVAEILGISRRYVDTLLDDGKMAYFIIDETKKQQQKRVLKAVLIAFIVQQNKINV